MVIEPPLEEERLSVATKVYADSEMTDFPGLECPTLVTERLLLRTPHDEDVDAIAHLANNPRIAEMLTRMPHPYDVAAAQDFIKRVRSGEMGNCIYAITQMDTGVFMGSCGIHPSKHGEGLEIGYWLGEPYWGQGYATEAAQALIDLAFRATNIEELYITCRTINQGSRNVILKSGFSFLMHGTDDSLYSGLVEVERYSLHRDRWIEMRHHA